jgi:hypothetical protein
MSPTGVITALALFSIGSGYLWVEGCVSIAERHGMRHPLEVASIATGGTPYFVLMVVLWLAWALYAERASDTQTKRMVHIPMGIVGCIAVFLLYIYAGLRMVGAALIVDV